MLGLGNSRCDRIEFEGGMGKVTLDFSGSVEHQHPGGGQDGARRAHAPPAPVGSGVRLTLDRFLASFDPAGLARVGNSFQSPGYDRAERQLDIDVTTRGWRREGRVGGSATAGRVNS